MLLERKEEMDFQERQFLVSALPPLVNILSRALDFTLALGSQRWLLTHLSPELSKPLLGRMCRAAGESKVLICLL
jgi:hypothetical protein